MQTIYLDISNKGVIPTINAKQGDVGRKFNVYLTNGGVKYTPTESQYFSVWYDGESGSGNYTEIGEKSAFSISCNVVTVEMITQMLSVPGDGEMCLVLNDANGDQIGSWNIPYFCEEVPGADSEPAKDYYTAFSKAVSDLMAGGGGGANIDDTNISTETTWSSHNIVDRLCPSFNESGATVTCEPLEGLPLEVVSHIVPKQAGSGEPSLTNIRPITGYDSIELSHTGKNLFGGEVLADVISANGGEKDAEDGTIFFDPAKLPNAGEVRLFDNFKENTQYTFIFYGRNTTGAFNNFNLWVKYTDGTYSDFQSTEALKDAMVVVTSTAGKTISCLTTMLYGGKTLLHYNQCGIFEGEISALDFEPYNNNGETFAIDLGQTVYGGTYNWHTGHLSVSYASIVFDGVTQGKKVTNTDSAGSNYAYFQPVVNGDVTSVKPKYGGKIFGDRTICAIPSEYLVLIRLGRDITGITDSDSTSTVATKINTVLKSWYDAGTPLTCVYELETPTIVQLTPQEILALEGTNILSSNTGDTEVKGKAVADAVIQDIYNKLNALTATLTALTGV